jgi:hypothetical protein
MTQPHQSAAFAGTFAAGVGSERRHHFGESGVDHRERAAGVGANSACGLFEGR